MYELDLFSQSQRRMLFGGGKPVAIVFTNDESRTNGRRAMLVAAKEWVEKYGVESMNFFLGDVNEHMAALKEFGLKSKDAPIAIVCEHLLLLWWCTKYVYLRIPSAYVHVTILHIGTFFNFFFFSTFFFFQLVQSHRYIMFIVVHKHNI